MITGLSKNQLQIFKHPGEVNKSACNWETPEAKHQPVQIPYIQTSSDTLRTGWYKDITCRLTPKAAYTGRLLLINPESNHPLTKLSFWKILIETDDYRLIQKSAFKFSNILARSTKVHATEKRPKPNTSQFKYPTYRRGSPEARSVQPQTTSICNSTMLKPGSKCVMYVF